MSWPILQNLVVLFLKWFNSWQIKKYLLYMEYLNVSFILGYYKTCKLHKMFVRAKKEKAMFVNYTALLKLQQQLCQCFLPSAFP